MVRLCGLSVWIGALASVIIIWPTRADAACGGTVRTWDAGGNTTAWATNNNWSPNNFPNTASEDVVVVSASRDPQVDTYTVGCVEVQSGRITSRNNRTLTYTGDYFRNLSLGGFVVNTNHTNFWIEAAGTSAQTFENVDDIINLRIANPSTVTLTNPFTIQETLEITGANSTLYVDADVTLLAGANPLTIPAGTTLRIRSGASLVSNANITVNGSLILDDGTSVKMGNGTTLSVASGGILQLNGSSGNIAKIQSVAIGSTFTFNMAGILSANYFRIDRTGTAGLNITGTVQSLNYGEFHFIANNGYGFTLGAAASIPATMNSLSFYNDGGYANVKNVNATSYNGTATSIDNWSGSVGGAANETDPNSKINWGAQAGTNLVLSNNTAANNPPATINQNSGDTLFATFSLRLNQASTATSITQVKFTMTGTGSANDISYVKLFRDAAASQNCLYNAGTDVQIGSNQSMSGFPPTVTFNIPPGDVQTDSDTNPACLHVIAGTTSSAEGEKTLQFSISSTGDVVNSQGYQFGPTSGPPVSAGSTTITGDAVKRWQGDTDDRWTRGANWKPNGAPATNTDCKVGIGASVARLDNGNVNCQNATFQTGGTINYDNTSSEVRIYGALTVESGFNFTNAASGVLAIRGANNQNLDMATGFPNNLLIANTGTSPNNVVNIISDTAIQGGVTVTSGKLSIANGVTLTVQGNVVVQSGATLEVVPGGELALGNGSTLTVNSGGILKLVGTPSLDSVITSVPSGAYTVVINGEIQAQYYRFDRLGTNGVSIESGATINATYHLQNGSFTYPVNNNTTFLKLKRQVPGNAIDSISFQSNGSTATSITNIDSTGASAGALSITTYTGDWSGESYDTDPSYAVNWSGATNTVDITREASGPANVDAGGSYNMGRYGFKQTLAGGSYADANLTSLTLQLKGTASSSDISEVKIYRDTDCDSAGGVLIGSGTFSGNPARKTFTLSGGAFVIAASAGAPPLNCIYVEYVFAGGAANGKTAGVEIASSVHVVNDQSYAPSGAISFPLDLGSAATIAGATNTTWTGTTNTDWFTGTNWSGGVPSSTKNCTINSASNMPSINGAGGTAECKNITHGSGTITLVNGTNARLDVYGALTSSGTIAQNNGVIRFIDGGTGASQNLTAASALTNVQVEKTGGGTVTVNSTSITINSLTFNGGNTGRLLVPTGKTLVLGSSVSVPNGTLEVGSGATLKMGSGTTITLNGGTFKTSGVHDTYPQNLSLKGKVTVNGAGTWGFTATSGTLSLVGFVLDYLNTNGLVVGGSTNMTDFRGGHFTNLSQSYSSMKVMQLNTANIPATPSDVEWYWGPNNIPPSGGDAYTLASSTGCGGNTISFNNWWGDFFDVNLLTPDPATKVSTTNCTITISYASSPVSILGLVARAFDGSVVVEWETGGESDHAGFNVLRSQSYDQGYVQLNSDLVRNQFVGMGPIGVYQFQDTTAVNGQVYYYIIEDVASGGIRTRHGPVMALPLSGLGHPAAPGSHVNDGSTVPGGDTGNGLTPTVPIASPGAIDLGHGVHIISQSYDSIRVEIIPPPMTIQASPLDGAYEVLNMPGYSKTLTEDHPELLEKVILIEVPNSRTTAEITNLTVNENIVLLGHLIQATPRYAPDVSGLLQPSHHPDSGVYSLSQYQPASFVSVASDLKSIGGQKYLELKVNPSLYNASSGAIRGLNKAIVDIGLDGQAWREPVADGLLSVSPSYVSGVLRIRVQSEGMYEVTYDDLHGLGVDPYLANVAVDQLRMYQNGEEIFLDIVSGDAFFNSGDKIRFWADFSASLESRESELVLSPWNLLQEAGPAKRVRRASADITAKPESGIALTEARAHFEKNLIYLNDRQVGDLEDRFFWSRLGKWTDGRASYYPDSVSLALDLPGLAPEAGGNVTVKLRLRGRHQFRKNGEHKVGIGLNANPNLSATRVFSGFYPETLDYPVPSSHFVTGENTLRLQVFADHLSGVDWALVDLDKIDVFYKSYLLAQNGLLEFFKMPSGKVVRIDGFTSSGVSIYDLSVAEDIVAYSDVSVQSFDSGATYQAAFAPPAVGDPSYGYRFIAVQDGAFKTPAAVFMNRGFDESLKKSVRRADLVIIGSAQYLASARRLTNLRRSQGLDVVEAPLDQIYAEFGDGTVKIESIRSFLDYAFSTWTVKPKYVLLLGDGTSDPRGNLTSSINENYPPVPFVSGEYEDYGSDNWYVSDFVYGAPRMAIGRLPASNQAELEQMIDKILGFESGVLAPVGAAKDLRFFSDTSSFFEQFSEKAMSLGAGAREENQNLVTSLKKADDYPDSASFKNAIEGDLNDGPLMTFLVGHGAKDQWGDDIFNSTHAKALSNSRLPMMVGLNCLTGQFYDANTAENSLGEALVKNPKGGSILYWGSTTQTAPTTQYRLTEAYLSEMSKALKANQKADRVGDFILRAKSTLAGQSSAKDVLQSYSLLGDPSMKLPASSYESPQSGSDTSAPGGGSGCGRVSAGSGPGSGPTSLWLLILPGLMLLVLRLRAMAFQKAPQQNSRF